MGQASRYFTRRERESERERIHAEWRLSWILPLQIKFAPKRWKAAAKSIRAMYVVTDDPCDRRELDKSEKFLLNAAGVSGARPSESLDAQADVPRSPPQTPAESCSVVGCTKHLGQKGGWAHDNKDCNPALRIRITALCKMHYDRLRRCRRGGRDHLCAALWSEEEMVAEPTRRRSWRDAAA